MKKSLNSRGFAHLVILILIMLATAVVGTYLLVKSKATTTNVTQVFSGNFGARAGSNTYTINTSAGTVDATLTTSKTASMTVTMKDSAGNQLATANGPAPLKLTKAVSGGTYQFTVSGSKTSYSLTVSYPPTSSTPTTTTTSSIDNFSNYTANTCFPDGSTFGPWTSTYNGYGCNNILSDAGLTYLQESPKVSTSANETHASLVTGPTHSGPIAFNVKAKTIKQLRLNTAPNPWETAWVVWNYTDDNHFYYFAFKTNGWELGKEDPAYPGAQRFLSDGTFPTFPVGQWNSVSITQDAGNKISVTVNGKLITTFTDTSTPYSSGRPGFYNEDSTVGFTDYQLVQ